MFDLLPMFAAFTSFVHFAISRSMQAANSFGVPPTTSPPSRQAAAGIHVRMFASSR
jgi:hypothetical protein